MRVVYTAGRFRGKTPWDVAQNVRRAEVAALEVARSGAMPLCPQANTSLFDGQLAGWFWVDGTLELMRRCDAVYVFDEQWRKSEGTVGEILEAISLSLPVFLTLAVLQDWVVGLDVPAWHCKGLQDQCTKLMRQFKEAKA